jgi:thymidylate synthase (FAD)
VKVEYVDHMGTDLTVANAARRSFGAGFTEFRTEADGPRSVTGRSDEALLMDLAKDGHWLPFRHPHVILSCDAPIPIARQLGKHQVGFEWSEISRRYKTKGIELYEVPEWRLDVKDRRQGSGSAVDLELGAYLNGLQRGVHAECVSAYEKALDAGSSPEQARFLLPQSMEVSWTWTGSLLAWAHLVKQRRHADAQAETREFARLVEAVIEPLFPYAWKALLS